MHAEFMVSLLLVSSLAFGTAQDARRQEPDKDSRQMGQTSSGVIVVFKDGRELKARSAIRVGDSYEVKMEDGIEGTFPAEEIKEVRPLTDVEKRDEQEKAERTSLGQKRSKERWIAEQYDYFKDKIAKVDGNYYSAVPGRFAEYRARTTGYSLVGLNIPVWPAGADQPRVEAVKGGGLQKGASGMLASAKVLNVLGSDTLLVTWEWYRGFGSTDMGTGRSTTSHIERDLIVYHVSGFPTESLVNGQDFPRTCMVVTGTFTYPTAAGGTNTVLGLKAVTTVNKEEFVQCLKQGLVLERWDSQPVRCPKCGGRGRVQIGWTGSGRRPLVNPCDRCGGSRVAMQCRRFLVHWPFAEPAEKRKGDHGHDKKNSMANPTSGRDAPALSNPNGRS